MTQLLTGVDFVFHLAAAANVDQIAKDPLSAIEHNVAGTGLLLRSRRANIARLSCQFDLGLSRCCGRALNRGHATFLLAH